MAGVVFKTKFISAANSSKKGGSFSGYLKYINRPEAARKDELNKYEMFNSYHDYMGNPEKSTGLFGKDHDFYNEAAIHESKEKFDEAQQKGSNLYQAFISFESEWLLQHGILTDDGVLREDKLREYTRCTVDSLLKAENAENWIWSAAIHHNTEHYHIHIAMVDPEPSWKENVGRCRRNKETGELYQRGKFKLNSIEKAKSTFVNLAIDGKEKNNLINEIIRDRIVLGKKLNSFTDINDKEIEILFNELIEELPDDMRLWRYKMNAMAPYRYKIDKLSNLFISKYYKRDYAEFEELLQEIADEYKQSYGDNKTGDNFYEQKHQDLYTRLGNAILNECKQVKKENRQVSSNNERKLHFRYTNYNNMRIMRNLKNVFKKDIASLKNQAAYERLLEEENMILKQ